MHCIWPHGRQLNQGSWGHLGVSQREPIAGGGGLVAAEVRDLPCGLVDVPQVQAHDPQSSSTHCWVAAALKPQTGELRRVVGEVVGRPGIAWGLEGAPSPGLVKVRLVVLRAGDVQLPAGCDSGNPAIPDTRGHGHSQLGVVHVHQE